jgi:hypothetical protein
MAHWFGKLLGARGEGRRLGDKETGFTATAHGDHVGATLVCRHEDGHDVVYVYAHGGRYGTAAETLIATLVEEPAGPKVILWDGPERATGCVGVYTLPGKEG